MERWCIKVVFHSAIMTQTHLIYPLATHSHLSLAAVQQIHAPGIYYLHLAAPPLSFSHSSPLPFFLLLFTLVLMCCCMHMHNSSLAPPWYLRSNHHVCIMWCRIIWLLLGGYVNFVGHFMFTVCVTSNRDNAEQDRLHCSPHSKSMPAD